MSHRFGIIIVTHNSQEVIDRCIEAIGQQSYPVDEIIVVDNGSDDPGYLDSFQLKSNIKVIKTDNIGFAGGNNLAVSHLSQQVNLIIFLNPDTFLSSDFTHKAEDYFRNHEHISILSGKLLSYDLQKDIPDGRIDSCGIFRKWYGRWYDRGHGEIDVGRYDTKQYVPALCGALLCCRSQILHQLTGELFDPEFFMYKEDIELSLRLRKRGFKLLYHPQLIAYHCRGWDRSRKCIDQEVKKLASKNEILLYRKHPSPYMIWAVVKYILVSIFRV